MADPTRHTLEPWCVEEGADDHMQVWPGIYRRAPNGDYEATIVEAEGYLLQENADRIVASVNALARIDDPQAFVDAARALATFNTEYQDADDLLRGINTLRRAMGYAAAEKGTDWPMDESPCARCGHVEEDHELGWVHGCQKSAANPETHCTMCKGVCPGEHFYIPLRMADTDLAKNP